jgi:cytochrome c556
MGIVIFPLTFGARMNLKLKLSALSLTLLMCTSLAAQAQFAKVEDAVEYRQASLSVMGTHFGRIAAVVKGEKPYDKATLENDAAIVEMLSKLPWAAFPAGSNTADSKAKPEIWKDSEKFKSAADKMQAEVVKLSAAAKSGDIGAIKTAFGTTAKSCKACHEDFKSK